MGKVRRRSKREVHIIRREFAERYMLVALLSFAGSVSVTRLFLSLSGYPQLGGGELHIAHVLWGGLLLFIAALLPLIFANRWVYSVGALCGGVGVGLFIDEVGKFITQKNDYFFPAAAPIIYVFFLLTVMLLIHIKVNRSVSRYEEMHKALDKIHELLEHSLSRKEQEQIRQELEILIEKEPAGKRLELARAIHKFLEVDEVEPPIWEVKPVPWKVQLVGFPKKGWQFIQENIRTLLIIGTILIGLLNLKNPVSEFLSPALPPEVAEMLTYHAGRQINSDTAMELYRFRVITETIVGSLLILGAILLLTKFKLIGCVVGLVAVLLCLIVLDLVLFYFEQFSTIMTTTAQFLLLAGYLYYLTQLTSKKKKEVVMARA